MRLRSPLSVGVVAGALVLAGAAHAEEIDRERLLSDLGQSFPGGAFTPTVGEWVVYRIGPEPYRYLRVAVLGRAPTKRGEGTWMEVDIGPVPLGGALSMKLLTVGDPREGNNVERAYFRLAGGMVQELDSNALGRLKHSSSSAAAPNQSFEPSIPAQDYSPRITHAGSFRSVKIDNGAGTVFWLSPEAPIFHLVSIGLPDRDMEIFAFGDKAVDTMGEPASRVTVKREVAAVDGGAR